MSGFCDDKKSVLSSILIDIDGNKFLISYTHLTVPLSHSRDRVTLSAPALNLLNKKTCEANPAGEDSSSIFTLCVKAVSFVYPGLHMAVKEFAETHICRWRNSSF